MKYIMGKIDFLLEKKYETTEIKVGDYLICNEPVEKTNRKLIKFLKNNIGVCVEIQDMFRKKYPYLIAYSNIPKDLHNYFSLRSFGNNYDAREFSKEEIIRHATSEEIEEYKLNQDMHKYNI